MNEQPSAPPQPQTISYPAEPRASSRYSQERIDPHVIVLFGATGDLARRKLLPGMAHLVVSALAPDIRIVGTSLEEMGDVEFREFARTAIEEFGTHELTAEQWDKFDDNLAYVPQSAGPEALAAAVAQAEDSSAATYAGCTTCPSRRRRRCRRDRDAPRRRPRRQVAGGDGEAVRHRPRERDRTSTPRCTRRSTRAQVFRIDHFLGKEAAQNILAFRFANGLFEPIWNRNFIDHIQIDIPETLGLDQRANFYESTGAYKDMVVTHLFQVLAFVAMEPPTALEPRAISEEKNKVFRSLLPIRAERRGPRPVRGLHRPGRGWPPTPTPRRSSRSKVRPGQLALGRRAVLPAHRQEAGRGRAHHLDRLQGGAAVDVPGRTRASARPARTTSPSTWPTSPRCRCPSTASVPGPGMRLEKLSMQFSTQETERAGDVLEAYERLILDAMRGDHTLFTTAEGIESLWDRSAALLDDPPAGQALSAGHLGPQRDPPADRAARLAAALRAGLARQEVRYPWEFPG